MRTLKLFIKALSLNTAYPTGRNGRRFLSQKGKVYKEEIGWAAREQGLPLLTGNLSVDYTFAFSDNRKHDLDNLPKLFSDALTGIWFCDDSQIIELKARKVKADQEYIEIKLKEV